MFVKGGLGFGVVDALRWPGNILPVWGRSGVGGHDRDESPAGGGDTLVLGHLPVMEWCVGGRDARRVLVE